jgi:alkaline phosphatase
MLSRRTLLKTAAAAALTGCAPVREGAAPLAKASAAAGDIPVGRARSIIFFAYDGLTYEDVATARYYLERHRPGRTLVLERLLGAGGSGCSTTHSISSIVTDSSAASSAWSTGRKIVNGVVSLTPQGEPLTTIMDLAREAGRSTGLVTTTRITHATPAGFIAKIESRDSEDEIAVQYLDFEPDLLLGGGRRHFDPSVRPRLGRDLLREFAARGYGVALTAEEMERSTASRLLGLFTNDHLPYEVDRLFQGVAAPSLADMTRTGLRRLDGLGRGFVLQVEAGRIDHANHGNDPGGTLWDVLAADEALAVAMEYVDENPETLLIVASDHGTGAGAIYGTGPQYNGSSQAFDAIRHHRASYEHLLRVLGDHPPADALIPAARDFFGITLSREQAERLSDALVQELWEGHPLAHRVNPRNSVHWLLTVANPDDPETINLNYATGAHTAGPVIVAVYGPRATTRSLGMVDNTDLFGWMTHALGVRFENPATHLSS